ncbi:DinB family protein [Thermomicrobiaceae bacterium CFH 74404]|uniref:DinB family protein n=1 Tax=Thermalbibacter longus TaxID=2951981 RepID=A0AA42B9A3_9BACT|nr:DinB family protein [Thermalbibacter longus]MCM8747917.1 DinB family protein [Thermalbibacter longus]
MLVEVIRTLYSYNRWATERVLDAAGRLTPEQLHAPGEAGHGSIHNTLLHIISTQRSWLSWWDGSLSPEEAYRFRLNPTDYPDLLSLRRAWEELERDTAAFVSRLSDDDLQGIREMPLPDGNVFRPALWQMMLHVANHGTQHRSEVAAMLTHFDCSPGGLDLLFYLWPRGAS